MIFFRLRHLHWILMEILTISNILDIAVFFLDRMFWILQLVTHLFQIVEILYMF
jgi:hypothetical protein